MSLRIYVEGQRDDVERFYNEIIRPEFGRLREDERFRVTENNQKYEERNKTTGAVERVIRGYSPTLRYRNRPGLWEKYVVEVEDLDLKKYGDDLEKVTDVQVKLFTVEKDTGVYLNRRRYSSRFFGGHFNDPEE